MRLFPRAAKGLLEDFPWSRFIFRCCYPEPHKFQLWAYVYQARDLHASDDTGTNGKLIDHTLRDVYPRFLRDILVVTFYSETVLP